MIIVINLVVTVWSLSLLQQNAVLEPPQLWTAVRYFISTWINTTLFRTCSWVLCISCGTPFAASCSAAVNSACHLPGGDIDSSAKPLPFNIVDEGFKNHGAMTAGHYFHQPQSFGDRRGLVIRVIEGCRSRCWVVRIVANTLDSSQALSRGDRWPGMAPSYKSIGNLMHPLIQETLTNWLMSWWASARIT